MKVENLYTHVHTCILYFHVDVCSEYMFAIYIVNREQPVFRTSWGFAVPCKSHQNLQLQPGLASLTSVLPCELPGVLLSVLCLECSAPSVHIACAFRSCCHHCGVAVLRKPSLTMQ